MEFEAKIIEFLQAGSSDFWNFFFKVISIVGSYIGIVALLIVAFFICRKRFLLLGGTLGGGLLINIVLKYIIQRDRPYVVFESIVQLGTGSGFSFPSSHATCVTILAVFLCYFVFLKSKKKSIRILTIVLSILSVLMVCLSRMYLGLHFFTDVLAGVVISGCVSIVAILIYEKFIDKWLSRFKIFHKKEKVDKEPQREEEK